MSKIDVEAVLSAARKEARLDDFGPLDFIEPLEVWLHNGAIAPVTEAGRTLHLQSTQRYLVNRLRLVADLKRHPEILGEDVSDPIVVLGFPRSGTTVLQRMLSANPAVQAAYFWRVLNPAPFSDEMPSDPVGRIAFAEVIETATRTLRPHLFAAHPSLARDAEEDWFLHHLGFRHVANACCGPFRQDYIDYLASLPRQQTYDEAANHLRYLQWQDGGRRGRPWILKSPAHIGYLREIVTAHPKASFVYLYRDFRTVVASFCYTLGASLDGLFSIHPHELGALSVRFWRNEMLRFAEARRQLGNRLRLLEIPYLDLLRDPLPHIRAIHEHAGLPLDEAGATAIRAWIADNPQNKHGKNVYTLEDYGLSTGLVDEAFGEFRPT